MILMEVKMDQFVGLDVSQEMTHLCAISGDGKIVWQGKCLSTPALPSERIALLTVGAAASNAMLWRALVSTTKRTLKPARAKPWRKPAGEGPKTIDSYQ
jgi:hypothetical protein